MVSITRMWLKARVWPISMGFGVIGVICHVPFMVPTLVSSMEQNLSRCQHPLLHFLGWNCLHRKWPLKWIGVVIHPSLRVCMTPLCLFSEGLLEQEDAKPLLKVLKQREFRWPVLGDALGAGWQWEESQFDLLQTLAEIRKQHSKSVLVRFYVSPDDKNSNKYIIKVSRPISDY